MALLSDTDPDPTPRSTNFGETSCISEMSTSSDLDTKSRLHCSVRSVREVDEAWHNLKLELTIVWNSYRLRINRLSSLGPFLCCVPNIANISWSIKLQQSSAGILSHVWCVCSFSATVLPWCSWYVSMTTNMHSTAMFYQTGLSWDGISRRDCWNVLSTSEWGLPTGFFLDVLSL